MDEFNDWLEEWALELQGSSRTGDETIKVYRRSVRQFFDWLTANAPDVTNPGDLTRAHVRGWYAHLAEQGKSEGTRRVRGIALRKFLAYIAAQPDGGMDANPADGFDLPVPKDDPIPIIRDDDLTRLLKSMSGGTFVDRRDTGIIRMLLDCGLRRAELVGIDVDDVDLRHMQVVVTGKGSKTRIIPFSGKTALALRKYLRARSLRPAAGSSALFLSIRSDAALNWRMTGGGVADMLSRRAQAAGLGHIHPHQFRHTWAADLKGANVSDDQLERLAGWSTPLMSRRYGSAVADQQARDTARKLARGDRV